MVRSNPWSPSAANEGATDKGGVVGFDTKQQTEQHGNVDSTFAKLQLNETTETACSSKSPSPTTQVEIIDIITPLSRHLTVSPSTFVEWLKTELDVETVEDLVEAVTECSDAMVAGGVKEGIEDAFQDGIINIEKNKKQNNYQKNDNNDNNNNNNRALRRPQNTIFLRYIPVGAIESDVRTIFEPYGNIISITMNSMRGFGFVDFDNPESVDAIIAEAESSLVKDPRTERSLKSSFMLNGRVLNIERKTPGRKAENTIVVPSRKAENTIVVRNIPYGVVKSEVRTLFEPYGHIIGIYIGFDFFFVDFDNPNAVVKILAEAESSLVKDPRTQKSIKSSFMLNGRVLQIFERKMPNNNYNDKENVDSTFAKSQLNETAEFSSCGKSPSSAPTVNIIDIITPLRYYLTVSPSAFVQWLKTELDVETVEDLVEAVTDCSDTMVAGGVKDFFEDVFRDGIINMGKNKEQYNNRALRRPQNTIFLKGMTFGVVESEVRSLFEPYGNIISVTLNSSRGSGFVDFDSSDAVDAIIAEAESSLVKDPRTERSLKSSFMLNGRVLKIDRKRLKKYMKYPDAALRRSEPIRQLSEQGAKQGVNEQQEQGPGGGEFLEQEQRHQMAHTGDHRTISTHSTNQRHRDELQRRHPANRNSQHCPPRDNYMLQWERNHTKMAQQTTHSAYQHQRGQQHRDSIEWRRHSTNQYLHAQYPHGRGVNPSYWQDDDSHSWGHGGFQR